MAITEPMKAVEARAYAARLTITDVLRFARVAGSTWVRAKDRGFIRASTLKRVEEAMSWYEREQAKRCKDN